MIFLTDRGLKLRCCIIESIAKIILVIFAAILFNFETFVVFFQNLSNNILKHPLIFCFKQLAAAQYPQQNCLLSYKASSLALLTFIEILALIISSKITVSPFVRILYKMFSWQPELADMV